MRIIIILITICFTACHSVAQTDEKNEWDIADKWWTCIDYNNDKGIFIWMSCKNKEKAIEWTYRNRLGCMFLKSDSTYEFIVRPKCGFDKTGPRTGTWHIADDTLCLKNEERKSHIILISAKKGGLITK